ncbi:hypothetical protein chiPu_0032445, partial [Chiloscyllium punctatum]|nr:hypothetical protein [Chiloscyllium punctatum]
PVTVLTGSKTLRLRTKPLNSPAPILTNTAIFLRRGPPVSRQPPARSRPSTSIPSGPGRWTAHDSRQYPVRPWPLDRPR